MPFVWHRVLSALNPAQFEAEPRNGRADWWFMVRVLFTGPTELMVPKRRTQMLTGVAAKLASSGIVLLQHVRGIFSRVSGPLPYEHPKVENRSYDNTLAEASPYFRSTAGKTNPEKKVKAGIVASVPFPQLFSTQFGLIQEKLAHDPFWLLIAVTFLIKTSGQVAIPAFYKVKERFPTPQQLADAGNAVELLDMIRHLGLAKNRLGFIRRYATAFLKQPPSPGVVYKVRNYDRRDPSLAVLEANQRPMASNGDPAATILEGAGADAEGWEIGHMTQGKYTLDSWRIFCRDEFLGRAEDWTGKGREPEFQPEWMRVMPHDKELRAYLRWMWMREGWEWNPETGERTVLGRELMEAVNEQRVAYDDAGGLRIVAVARDEGP
ncbi:methyl-CpG-binding domain-containing protein 4 [Moelleriella libera RCEF 2490]|uniref:Methyl-CpG-binding domain-containing protein 4 n=1 Tax=Moelleriella libera RCEF 2490 TaxID=1081109 RepID=A0A166UV74_9HYPO|nr:methyl-CpG-binding domain-containing protein 4 [Moelleriella libera RCEF 2490]